MKIITLITFITLSLASMAQALNKKVSSRSPKVFLSEPEISELKNKWRGEENAEKKRRALMWFNSSIGSENATEMDALQLFRKYLAMSLDEFLDRGKYKEKVLSQEKVCTNINERMKIVNSEYRLKILVDIFRVFSHFENIEKQVTISDLKEIENRVRIAQKKAYIGVNDLIVSIAQLYINREKYSIATSLCYEALLTSAVDDSLIHLYAYKALSKVPKQEAFLRLYSRLFNEQLNKGDNSFKLRTLLLYKEFQGRRIDRETVVDITKFLPLLSNEAKKERIPFYNKIVTFEEHIKDLKPIN